MKILSLRRPAPAPIFVEQEPVRPQDSHFAWYRPKKDNPCPGCGRHHWLVGRKLAECSHCSTALPIAR